jgi:uncharacterized protein YlaI
MAKPEKIRLWICHECKSVDAIPWCGEDPNCEHPMCVDALEYRVAPHRLASDSRRFHGQVNLADIEKSLWDKYSTREDVLVKLQQIVDPGAGSGLGQPLYTIAQNFDADASACWRQHNRTHNCQDFKSQSKRLVPDTKAERKDLGLETRGRHRPTQTYLCDWCPVKSIMMQRQNSETYGYNYDG